MHQQCDHAVCLVKIAWGICRSSVRYPRRKIARSATLWYSNMTASATPYCRSVSLAVSVLTTTQPDAIDNVLRSGCVCQGSAGMRTDSDAGDGGSALLPSHRARGDIYADRRITVARSPCYQFKGSCIACVLLLVWGDLCGEHGIFVVLLSI